MGFGSIGGGGLGASIGSAAARAVKSRSAGGATGRSIPRVIKPRSSGSGGRRSIPEYRRGGGSGSRRSIPENNYRSGGGGTRSIPENSHPVPKIPGIDAYLGTDATYQNAVRGGKRSLADFISELGRRRGEAGTQYKTTQASMERDRVQQLDDLRQEFASRGLINSGLFGEEQGKFQQQFTQQSQALSQQQAALLADLMSQQKNYQREQDLALEAAKQEALARRAAKYKIGA